MNRLACQTVVAVGFLTWTSLALAADVTADGVARSASANFYMRTICPTYFTVDIAAAEKLNAMTLDLGGKMFGPTPFKQIVAAEALRRSKEVEATGRKAWCSYQRSSMSQSGLEFLFR